MPRQQLHIAAIATRSVTPMTVSGAQPTRMAFPTMMTGPVTAQKKKLESQPAALRPSRVKRAGSDVINLKRLAATPAATKPMTPA